MDAVKDEVREEEEEDRSRFMEEDESPWRPLKGKVGEEENKVMATPLLKQLPHTTLQHPALQMLNDLVSNRLEFSFSLFCPNMGC